MHSLIANQGTDV